MKKKNENEFERGILWFLYPNAVVGFLFLMLGLGGGISHKGLLIGGGGFVFALSGVLCLLSRVYWAALLQLCVIALFYVWFSVDGPKESQGWLEFVVAIIEISIFLWYVAVETLKRFRKWM